MTLAETLISVWQQVLVEDRPEVRLGERTYRVTRTRNRRLRTVSFSVGEDRLEGIEQNPETGSRWAKLAQTGQRILQFSYRGKYVGNVCEGRFVRYPAWNSLGLPE